MILSGKTDDRKSHQPALNPILLLGMGLGLLADLLWWSGDTIGLGFVVWVSLFGLSADLGKDLGSGQRNSLILLE